MTKESKIDYQKVNEFIELFKKRVRELTSGATCTVHSEFGAYRFAVSDSPFYHSFDYFITPESITISLAPANLLVNHILTKELLPRYRKPPEITLTYRQLEEIKYRCSGDGSPNTNNIIDIPIVYEPTIKEMLDPNFLPQEIKTLKVCIYRDGKRVFEPLTPYEVIGSEVPEAYKDRIPPHIIKRVETGKMTLAEAKDKYVFGWPLPFLLIVCLGN